MRNVRLRLIVIIITDKILHRIFREELPELRSELGSEYLVVGQHQGRPLYFLYNLCHGICFARASNTYESLLLNAHLSRTSFLWLGLIPQGKFITTLNFAILTSLAYRIAPISVTLGIEEYASPAMMWSISLISTVRRALAMATVVSTSFLTAPWNRLNDYRHYNTGGILPRRAPPAFWC